MNMKEHASRAEKISEAAQLAGGIEANLKSINAGQNCSTMKATQVDQWFVKLASLLGYKVEKEPT